MQPAKTPQQLNRMSVEFPLKDNKSKMRVSASPSVHSFQVGRPTSYIDRNQMEQEAPDPESHTNASWELLNDNKNGGLKT